MVNKVTGVAATKIQSVMTRLSLNGPKFPNQKKIMISKMTAKLIKKMKPKNDKLPKLEPFWNNWTKKSMNMKRIKPVKASGNTGLGSFGSGGK